MLQFVGWTSQDNSQKNSATNATMQITDNQKRAFIAQILPIAQAEQQKYKIFASITLAQAALESDWGQSQLASQYHNLFGVKSSASDAQLLTTKEYVNGQWITVQARFATYASWKQSVQAHTQLFVNGTAWDHAHYEEVLTATNYQQAAEALQKKGYATDPEYAQKLISLIKEYQLNKYDGL
ncbi:lysozyme [Liquorilactobacillus satsumensis]|nr:lysozyme [Liquorilactobacillus satsumensis]